MTDPAVGAWTWASGSQVCSGHIGTLTANDANIAIQIQRWASTAIGVCSRRSMSVEPARLASVRIAIRNSTDPARV